VRKVTLIFPSAFELKKFQKLTQTFSTEVSFSRSEFTGRFTDEQIKLATDQLKAKVKELNGEKS
jgi:hypothetical protein